MAAINEYSVAVYQESILEKARCVGRSRALKFLEPMFFSCHEKLYNTWGFVAQKSIFLAQVGTIFFLVS